MKRPVARRAVLASMLVLSLALSLTVPASAFFWNRKDDTPSVADFSKNGLVGTVISFTQEDFVLENGGGAGISAITIDTLPDPGAGTLLMGGQPIQAGSLVEQSALGGLRFQCSPNPSLTTATFTFTPILSSSATCETATVTLYLLTEENQAPIARNMDLSTYKNVAITGYFDAVDSEGDLLTFQLTSTPARGAVTMAEDGSSRFVYTPYEDKTGSDSFTYVAVDPAGNTSPEAKDKVIELARLLTPYTGRLTVHVVPFTAIQEELRRSCPEELFTIIMRRFMMRISQEVAKRCGARAWSLVSVWARWPARPWRR